VLSERSVESTVLLSVGPLRWIIAGFHSREDEEGAPHYCHEAGTHTWPTYARKDDANQMAWMEVNARPQRSCGHRPGLFCK
jgi:hypothetical protein